MRQLFRFVTLLLLHGCTVPSPQDAPHTGTALPESAAPVEAASIASVQNPSDVRATLPEPAAPIQAADTLPIPRPRIPVVCARAAIPPIIAEVRDAQGEPAAIGAFVTLRSDTGFEATAKGFGDSLQVIVGQPVEGRILDVEVAKPWHTSAVVREVEVSEDWCGIVEPTYVSVTLSLLPDAPPVRQVVASPSNRLRVHVVAAPGVSREVTWVSRDTMVVRLLPDGTYITPCPTARGSTWVVASLVVDPTKHDSVQVHVRRDPRYCLGYSGPP